MSLGTDEERMEAEFAERKDAIMSLLVNATNNYPPIKEDIAEIFNEFKILFPDLEILKKLMLEQKLASAEKISDFWWDKIPIVPLYMRIERGLKMKPFNAKRREEVFADLLWLSFELLFKEDFRESTKKEGPHNKYRQVKRQIRAEKIVLSIPLINAKFREITGFDDVNVFREDVGSFFVKLPSQCEGAEDFLARIQSLGSIFEVNLKSLRKIASNVNEGARSIEIINRWLEDKKIAKREMVIDTWKNILLLRNAPPTHSEVKPQVINALKFFNVPLPINYTILWDSILDRFEDSLELFQEIITH